MTGRLTGKVALVTGAARGIGRAQAVRFAQEGADIIALDICAPVHTTITPPATRADLDKTSELVESAGRRVIPGVVDVRNLRDVQTFTQDAVTEFGGLDIVCATAGITSRGMLLDMPESDWQTMLNVNLTGVWHTTRAATPHLIARGGGAMVLVSSIAGLRGLVGVSHYVAAKHGVVGLMRALAIELAPPQDSGQHGASHQRRYPDDSERARAGDVPARPRRADPRGFRRRGQNHEPARPAVGGAERYR